MGQWREIEETPHEIFYLSKSGNSLYIHDSHRGRLRKEGDQYHYHKPGEYTSTLTTGDDLNELEDLVDELLTSDRNSRVTSGV